MPNLIQNVELTSRGIKKVLNKFTPQRALAEYVWNGYDAYANKVRINYEVEPAFQTVTKIEVEDDGEGIVHDELSVVFKKFYESQKSQTGNLDSRFSRGKNGYGRFTFFKFSREAQWKSVYKKEDNFYSFEINMSSDDLTTYHPTAPSICDATSTGTTVLFPDLSDFDFSREWVYATLIPYLKSEFAWYFKVHPEKELYINGELLDCSTEIADSELFDVPIELEGIDSELFHCSFFQWSSKPQEEYSRFYFMDASGNLKAQKTTLLNKKGDSFWHSVLIKSTFFNSCADITDSEGNDLFSTLPERKVMKELTEYLNNYLRNKRRPFLKEQANVLVGKYEEAHLFNFLGSNIWDQKRKSCLQDFIKDLFEVEPAIFLKLNDSQKKIFIRLLDQVMDTDTNGTLFTILGEVIELDEEDKNKFAHLLETTRLKNVISTIQLIEDRLATINDLKQINFDHSLKAGEVAHLQKLIEYHYWLFGEEYRFVCAEETKFQEALEKYLYILRGVTEKEYLSHPDKYKEMDLFITGKEHMDGRPSNLVIEIKNPTTVPVMKMDQYSQINTYMDVIMLEDGFNDNQEYWTFMLIGNDIDSTVKRQMKDKLTGLCIDESNSRLFVKKWSQILNEAEDRLNYLIERLKIEREKLAASDNLDSIMFRALHNSAKATDVN